MSQNASPSQSTLEATPTHHPIVRSVEANADQLMDELFGTVEQMLERGTALVDWVEPDPNLSQAIAPIAPSPDATASTIGAGIGPSVLPPQLADRSLALEELDLDEMEDLLLLQPDAPAPASKSFDKILLAAIAVSLLTTGALWYVWQRRLPVVPAAQPSATASTAASPLPAPTNNAFLDYVTRSLDRLEKSVANQNPGDRPAASPSPTVLERVYIPVYSSPLATAQPSPTASAPVRPSSPLPAVPVGPTATNPTRPATPTAPVAAVPSTATTIPTDPSETHVLIGLLELGDRNQSAGLFEINGNTQRIQVGEKIGSSGWTLVSISNQQAVIRRNGDVRAIYVGQTF